MLTKTTAILWRLYYVLITVLIMMGVMYTLSVKPDLYQIQYLIAQVLALIALHGYITRRNYFHHLFLKGVVIWYLVNFIYELYLYLNLQLYPHSLLNEFLVLTAGTDIHFNTIIMGFLSATRDGLLLPLIYALIKYTQFSTLKSKT